MVARPNVILAASNAYDAIYLERAFGRAPLPWPATAPHLAPVPYMGTRRSILFCCGSTAYNPVIRHLASTVVNASRTADTRRARLGGKGRRLVFAWPSEVYKPCGSAATSRDFRPVHQKD